MAISEYPLKSKYICNAKAIIPIQEVNIEISLSGITLISLQIAPIEFANKTFLPNPIMNLCTPDENWVKFSFLFLSWLSISLYFTIGPAISWGNIVIYAAKFIKFFCTFVFFVYTSIMYEICWNV